MRTRGIDWPIAYDLIWTLLTASRPLGRRSLEQRTGITEMTVRTHLNKLRAAGYVKMAKAGTALTAQGQEAFATLKERVPWLGPLTLRDLALDRYGVAAILRNFPQELKESWRYRDAAIREGASGALLLVRTEGGWAFSDEPLSLAEQYPQDAALLERALPFSGAEDALAVVFGPEPSASRRGLWRIVVELLPPPNVSHHTQQTGG